MKTKSSEMKQETEKRFMKYCEDEDVKWIGCPIVQPETFSEEYKQLFAKFEKVLLAELLNLVRMQN